MLKTEFLKILHEHGYMTVQRGGNIEIFDDTEKQTYLGTVYNSTHFELSSQVPFYGTPKDDFLSQLVFAYTQALYAYEKELIGISKFVKRQTKESRFSYYDGTFEELKALTEKCYKDGNVEQGYRDGVVLVTVPNEGFYSSICKIDENSILETVVERRQGKEDAFSGTTVVNGKKSPSKLTKIVLYSHKTLIADSDGSCNSDWEIVSINCEINEEESPIHPVTMRRNKRHYVGGTEAEYMAEEYMKAIEFWSTHALFKGTE